ncbi:MAG: precorrin-2 C(20)-methyltransferase [Cyanobacteria bacterium P01_A01_bin.135]
MPSPEPGNSPQTRQFGTLYGISVGPGDPELISVKGLRVLQAAPVVAFPASTSPEKPGVAQGIIAPWRQPHQKLLPLHFPYTQDAHQLNRAWAAAAEAVGFHLAQQQDVAFVSEGDVSFYSTFTYLTESLRRQMPQVTITAIPGVCSPLAAAAALQMPLTLGDQRLTVLPALYSVSNLETALDNNDVVVLMKVSSVYGQVWQILQQRQLLASSYVVEWATHDRQRLYHGLSDRPQLALSYFSLMVITVAPSHYGTLP